MSLYNSSGEPQGINTKVNDDAGSAEKHYPSISMHDGGNFVIVWRDFRNGFTNPDIYSQRYIACGISQGINNKVSNFIENATQDFSSISMDRQGNFVIAWGDNRNGNSDIYFQRYNSNGVVQGINTQANDDIVGACQVYPSISMDSHGNFVIAWQDHRNGNSDIYYQRYNSNGMVLGINAKANDDVVNASQMYP